MTEETNNMRQSMIHPTAVIDPQAKIGAGVKIGPYACLLYTSDAADEL